jgi:hypothetical protein
MMGALYQGRPQLYTMLRGGDYSCMVFFPRDLIELLADRFQALLRPT